MENGCEEACKNPVSMQKVAMVGGCKIVLQYLKLCCKKKKGKGKRISKIRHSPFSL